MLGEAAALGAAACWAVGSHLFGRIGKGGAVPAGAMNLGKCATATLLFGVAGLAVRGHLLPSAPTGELGWLAASGFVGLALGDSAYFGAIVTIGVRRALLLLSTAPVFAAVGGVLLLRERLGAVDALGIAAVLVGVALVVTEGTAESTAAAEGKTRRGLALGLFAGLAQAAGSLMSRHGMRHGLGALDASLVRIAAGFSGLVVVAALLGTLRPWLRVLLGQGPVLPGVPVRRGLATLGAVAGSATVGTFVGIGLAQYAIAHASSTAVATTLLATSPLFALPIGRWVAAERLTARAVGGTVVAVAGLWLLTGS